MTELLKHLNENCLEKVEHLKNSRDSAKWLTKAIPEKIDEIMSKDLQAWPARWNNCSEAGHDCERYLVYRRTHGTFQSPMPLNVKYIVEEGKHQEVRVHQAMQDAGFDIANTNTRYEWPELQLSGKIDGTIEAYRGERINPAIPFDTKSMAPHIYQSINTIEDFNKYPWTKKYIAQLLTYLLMRNVEDGIFVLKNKSNGRIKCVHIPLDYEYAEGILQRLERVNKHVEAKTLPDRIDYAEDICGMCSFSHICMPEEQLKGAHIEASPELIAMFDERERLKSYEKAYKELDKEIKEKYKLRIPDESKKTGEKYIIGGKYELVAKWTEKKIPAKEAGKQEFWTLKIKSVDTD